MVNHVAMRRSCDELLFQYRLDYSSESSRAGGIRFFGAWWCTAAGVYRRNIIGYAAVVVCLFAAYLPAPTIKSNRKTWMECRNDERQCIPARQRPALPPSSYTDTRAKSQKLFSYHEQHGGDRGRGRNLLISCRLQELRKQFVLAPREQSSFSS